MARFKKGNTPWNKGKKLKIQTEQTQERKQSVPEYFCPYKCGHTVIGNIGWKMKMRDHVDAVHPNGKLGDFTKLVPSHFRVNPKNPIFILNSEGEKPMVEELKIDVNKQNISDLVETANQTMPMTQPPEQTVVIPQQTAAQRTLTQDDMTKTWNPQAAGITPGPMPQFEEVQEPDVWLDAWLKQYAFTIPFIQFMVQKTKMTRTLPTGNEFIIDVKEMNPSMRGDRYLAYIKFFYETALSQYVQKKQESARINPYLSAPVVVGGMMIGGPQPGGMVQNPFAPQNPFLPQQQQFPQQTPNPQTGMYQQYPQLPQTTAQDPLIQSLMQQVKQMQDDAARQREENYRQQAAKIQDLENKIANGMRDPRNEKLEAMITMMQEQQRQTLQKELEEIKAKAGAQPSYGDIVKAIEDSIEKQRARVTATDIKEDLQKQIQQAIGMKTGAAQYDVELKKIDKDYDIELKKMEAEKNRGEMWAKIVPEAVGMASQAITQVFKGGVPNMNVPATAQPVSQEGGVAQNPSQPRIIICPNPECRTAISIPPGVTVTHGACPKCKRMIDLSEPSQTAQPETQTYEPTPEERFIEEQQKQSQENTGVPPALPG